MYKSNTELIVIDAKATEPIPTNVVFWSHDKGTAKMLFQLQKDYVNQTLSEGTIVPICLDFVGGRHIYHAVIEDAVNGIVSIVLEDNILGYQGRVDGSIYIELPDSRSLDTAGRFTFHIKRSPIDEDVPELENYYWQGFSDIMEQYHESIAEIKLEAKTTLDSLTADVTTAKNKVSTLEQSITTANTNLNTRIDEINKKIDENDVFTKAESSANVIYQLIGKEEAEILITADFKEKITGSVVENPNIIRFLTNSTFMAPLTGSEPGQVYYDGAMTKDGVTLNVGNTNSDYMSQIQLNWNLVEIVDRTIPELFETVGLTDDSEKIEFIKKNVSYIKNTVDGVGTGLSRNRLTFKTYDSAGVLETEESVNDTAKIQELVREYADRATIKNMISDRGFLSALLFTEASDGVAVSQASLDYTKLEFKIKVSANLLIKLMIAQNHVDNLATQTEATTASDNTKTMTPLRTKQLLDAKLLNMVYPIGSIYMSVNSATPATLFGGTWERFSKGRVLVGVDEDDEALKTVGTNGGSTNPLTAHTHTTQLTTYRVTSAGSGTVNNLARSTDQGNAATGEFGATSSAGDNTDHNNWQPFTTVYIWKRTA